MLWQSGAGSAAGISFSWSAFLSALAGWAGGAVTSILLFRGRLDVHEERFNNLKNQLERERATDKQLIENQLRELRETFGQQCASLGHSTDTLASKFDTWTIEARRSLEGAARDSRRREEFLIELVAAIAKKAGVRHRLTDVLAQLSETEEDDTPRGG